MPKIDDGGPAFPRPASIDTSSGTLPDGDTVIREQGGMSLRDYVAGQALVGLLAFSPEGSGQQMTPEIAAADAYAFADAVIAARKPK